MLNVQEYLENNTLEDLESEFGIVVTRYDDRVVLNYSQIDSPKFHPICDECRGLILSYPEFGVLSRSFNRFYRYMEGGHFQKKDFDITRSQVCVKYDGSLINLYHDGMNWNCATRKMAFAEGETNKGNIFKSVVEKALGFSIEELEGVHKDYTIICEVVSPETRVVIPYPETRLYVLGIRDKHTGEYLSVDDVYSFVMKLSTQYGSNVYSYEYFKVDNVQNVLEMAKNLNPMSEDGEGYVCFDPVTENRVKIKNPSYDAIAHLRENGAISNKKIAQLVFDQDHEEYLGYFEEDREFFVPYINAYNKMREELEFMWDNTKGIGDQKKFALQVKDHPLSMFLFQKRKGLGFEQIVDNLNKKKKQELLERFM